MKILDTSFLVDLLREARTSLLIGASALVHSASLVTRNVREFSRIPGLRVVPVS